MSRFLAPTLLCCLLTLPVSADDLPAAPELAALGAQHGCKATFRRDIKLGEPKSAQLVLDNDSADKIVVYRDEVKFEAKPLQPQAVEMFTTIKLLEFPANVSFYQSKAKRFYTFIEPGQSMTILKTPQGSGFYAKRIIDEGKFDRAKPVYLIKQVVNGYAYREGSGVDTSPTLDSVDCSFYYLIKY